MKKGLLRLTSALVICCIILTMTFSVHAQEDILGTDANITGYIVPNDANNTNSSRAITLPEDFGDDDGYDDYTEIFTITAAEVTELLTSNHGNKSFRRNDLPSTATILICRATLGHSLYDGTPRTETLLDCTRAGVCYYGYDYVYQDYVYISVYYESVPSILYWNEMFSFSFRIDEYLEYNEYYYTYVKNRYPAGYVYGTVSLYHN